MAFCLFVVSVWWVRSRFLGRLLRSTGRGEGRNVRNVQGMHGMRCWQAVNGKKKVDEQTKRIRNNETGVHIGHTMIRVHSAFPVGAVQCSAKP